MLVPSALGKILASISKNEKNPRIRLLLLAKILFNLDYNDLRSLTFARFEVLVGERLPKEMKAPLVEFVQEQAERTDSTYDSRIARSRNYGGKYEVVRQTIWKWLKGSKVSMDLIARQLKPLMAAITALVLVLFSDLVKTYPSFVESKGGVEEMKAFLHAPLSYSPPSYVLDELSTV